MGGYRNSRKKKMICRLILLTGYSLCEILGIYTRIFSPKVSFKIMRRPYIEILSKSLRLWDALNCFFHSHPFLIDLRFTDLD